LATGRAGLLHNPVSPTTENLATIVTDPAGYRKIATNPIVPSLSSLMRSERMTNVVKTRSTTE
jgi:hypothetical protein